MFLDVRCPGCSGPRFSLFSPICQQCVRPFSWSLPVHISGISGGVAGALHQGNSRNVVLAGKSGGRSAVFSQLGASFARTSVASECAIGCDVVTWVPASGDRSRVRGYDQGSILAESIARRLRLPVQRLVGRVDDGHQAGRSLEQRRVGPKIRSRFGAPPSVLLVDDVVTTGTSVRATTAALRSAGAESVYVVALTIRQKADN